MRSMKRRFSYANVIATLALFVAIGGIGYAAVKLPKNSVGTKQIKANAVKGSKVANGSLTGDDVDASTLGKVPTATRADSAAQADNASKLGGSSASAFLSSGDVKRIDFNPTGCNDSSTSGCLTSLFTVSDPGGSSALVQGQCSNAIGGREVVLRVQATGMVSVNEEQIKAVTNTPFAGSSLNIVDNATANVGVNGTAVIRLPSTTAALTYHTQATGDGPFACEIHGVALIA